MPEGIMSTAAQMLAAAPVILVVGLVSGERFDAVPDMSGWLALLYLAIPGSVVALTAYTYLLQNVRPALATSYAYVNPVVAVILGVTIGGEVLSGRALIALPIILAAVGLVLMQRSRTAPGSSRQGAGPDESRPPTAASRTPYSYLDETLVTEYRVPSTEFLSHPPGRFATMNTNNFQRFTRTTERPDIASALSNLVAAGIEFEEVHTCGDPGCPSCSGRVRVLVGAAA
jgi:hypothetical protein